MSKIGFGHQVTVHISQHFHHSEVMEEVDNEIKKIKNTSCGLTHVYLSSPEEGKRTQSL